MSFKLLDDCVFCESFVEGMKRGAYQNFDDLEKQPGWKFIIGKVPKSQRSVVEGEVRKVFATQSMTTKMLMENKTVRKFLDFAARPFFGKLKMLHYEDTKTISFHQSSNAW